MLKRLWWLVMGAGFGFGMSFWLTRLVRQTAQRTADRYAPSRLARGVEGLVVDLRVALAEGRQAMHERERELRTQVEARR